MIGQKRLIEIIIYVLLLAVGLFFYVYDETSHYKKEHSKTNHQHIWEAETAAVPEYTIDYDYTFSGEE